MALFLLVFHGGQAGGAVLWGAAADRTGTDVAFLVVAGGLVTGLLAVPRYRVRSGEDLDLSPSRHWAEPQLALERDPGASPVLVTVDYRVPSANQSAFRDAMQAVGRSRRRLGATRWSLFQDPAEPDRSSRPSSSRRGRNTCARASRAARGCGDLISYASGDERASCRRSGRRLHPTRRRSTASG
jgi:hypothetical protein